MMPKDQAQADKEGLGELAVTVLVSVVAVIIVVSIGSMVLNVLSENTENTPMPVQTSELPQIIELTASQLYAEYQADEAAADVLYTGKPIKVMGDLANWGRVIDLFYITLATDDAVGDFVRCDFIDYTFMPREWSRDSIMSPLLGSTMTVTGVCLGLFDDYVIITECVSSNMPDYLPE